MDQPSSAGSRASGVQVVVGVDPADAIEVVTDPVADLNRVAAVVALALVPGGRRDVLTDLCTGAGVVADAVVAPVARQVGNQAHVVLAAGFHTAGIPALGEVNQPRADLRPAQPSDAVQGYPIIPPQAACLRKCRPSRAVTLRVARDDQF